MEFKLVPPHHIDNPRMALSRDNSRLPETWPEVSFWGLPKHYWYWALREATTQMNLLPVQNGNMTEPKAFVDIPDSTELPPDDGPQTSVNLAKTVSRDTAQEVHSQRPRLN